jgi:hypothetical protein
MANAKVLTALLAGASLLIAGELAAAPQGKGPPGERGQQQQGEKGQKQAAKHNHKHMNGHNLLGAKLKQNGKHEVGKLKDRTVTADVENGKVKNMAAGDLPMKRVKSNMKMASLEDGVIRVPSGGTGLQLAQYSTVVYYGFCFDDGYDFDCYWYPAEDVDYVDYTWDDYYPYY